MKHVALTLLILTLVVPNVFAADTFTVDKAHTSVEFGVSHMVISTVKGQFNDFSGSITYGGKDLSAWKIKGNIKVASIDTKDQKRDGHLRSPDFFNAEKYPLITFESTKFFREKGSLLCEGKLTIKGKTKKVKIPVSVKGPIKDPWGMTRLGLQATLTINRQDFGVSWNKTLDTGGLVVGNEVSITLNVEAVKAKK